MPVIVHEWVTRARCACGYLWTIPGSSDVVCKCGATAIVDDVPQGAALPVSDEAAYKAAVATDLGVAEQDLDLRGP